MKKNFLIVGGTSDVGRHLARHYVADGHTVTIAGPDDPGVLGVTFHMFSVSGDTDTLAGGIDGLLSGTETVHTLIYICDQRGRDLIDTLCDSDLSRTVNNGLLAPMMLVQRLKKRSDWPLKIMFVTSDAQKTPYADAAADCAAQAGLGMLGAALVRDMSLGKVLVAAHSGETASMTQHDAIWVAQEIVALSGGAFKYKAASIDPDQRGVTVTACLNSQMARI